MINSVNKLEKIFAIQTALQKKMNAVFNIDYYKTMQLALENELHEALRELPWKPWKKNQQPNIENCKNELIDALHFYINLCLYCGMTSNELFKKYCEKNKINFERQNNNY